MNREKAMHLAPMDSAQFSDYASASCPDCESRFPLQLMIADLLRKNQMLRMELDEARIRISNADKGLSPAV